MNQQQAAEAVRNALAASYRDQAAFTAAVTAVAAAQGWKCETVDNAFYVTVSGFPIFVTFEFEYDVIVEACDA